MRIPERSLDAAVFMIFSNNGERCTAGSRILVQRSIYADFVARFAERARRITVGDPLDEKTIVGPMISAAHLAKVRGYIELGPREGATLMCGGLEAPALPAALPKGTTCSRPSSPMSTTGCGSRRTRSSARSPA